MGVSRGFPYLPKDSGEPALFNFGMPLTRLCYDQAIKSALTEEAERGDGDTEQPGAAPVEYRQALVLCLDFRGKFANFDDQFLDQRGLLVGRRSRFATSSAMGLVSLRAALVAADNWRAISSTAGRALRTER